MSDRDGVEITVLEKRFRYFVRYPPKKPQDASSASPAKPFVVSILDGRDGGIRTRDPLNPIPNLKGFRAVERRLSTITKAAFQAVLFVPAR